MIFRETEGDTLTKTVEPSARGTISRAEEFEAMFRLHFGKIRGYLRRQGLSPERSSELAQETFFRAWRAFDDFREDASPSTWLFTIARRLLLNELRSRRALKRNSPEVSLDEDDDNPLEIPGPGHDPENHFLEEEDREVLLRALESLPEQMRQCMQLRLGDLKYREIAEIQGISIETVKSHLHQGRRRLAELLSDHFAVDLDDDGRKDE